MESQEDELALDVVSALETARRLQAEADADWPNGWDFERGPGKIQGRRRESYVSTIEFPSDVDSLRIVFREAEVLRIVDGDRFPQKVVDGKHRLACVQVLEHPVVPTVVHFMERR